MKIKMQTKETSSSIWNQVTHNIIIINIVQVLSYI